MRGPLNKAIIRLYKAIIRLSKAIVRLYKLLPPNRAFKGMIRKISMYLSIEIRSLNVGFKSFLGFMDGLERC